MNISSHYRFEGSVFFIYDHNVLKKEEDRLEDAIIYFYPHTMPIDNQCLLCGQLMGLVRFSNEMFGSSPILYQFKKEKIAVKHVGQYCFALAGSNIEPNSMLIDQLDRLYNLFSFYHGSVDRVKAECNNNDEIFRSEMRSLWELYLAYIRNYGDQLPSVFNPVSHLPANHAQKHCFLKASHILQAFQRRPCVIAGCILYNRFILCSQLTDSISRCLLLLKPNQHLHPAIPIETDFPLPYGVRLFSVYLDKEDFNYLLNVNESSPYSANEDTTSSYKCCCKRKPNSLRRKIRTQILKTVPNQTQRSSSSSSERDPMVSEKSSSENTTKLCRSILEELLYKGFKCCKCLDEMEGEFDEGSLCSVDTSAHSRSHVDEISHSSECPSEENGIVFEKVGLEDENVVSDRATFSVGEGESGIEITCSDFYSSTNTPLEQTGDTAPDTSIRHRGFFKTQQNNNCDPNLDKSFKKNYGISSGNNGSQKDEVGSQGIRQGSQGTKVGPRVSPVVSYTDECDLRSHSDTAELKRTLGGHVEPASLPDEGLLRERGDNTGVKGTLRDHGGTLRSNEEDFWEDKDREDNVGLVHEGVMGKLELTGNEEHGANKGPEGTKEQCGNDGSQGFVGETSSAVEQDSAAEKKEHTSSASSEEKNTKDENDVEFFLKCCDVDGLVHANLFVQAHSEIVLILLTNCDLHQKQDVVKSLWSGSLSQIGELDMLLRQSSKLTKDTVPTSYNCLIYDNLEKTMSGNFKEPVFSGDLVFCDTAKLLHAHFQNAPQLVDVTLRNLQSGIYGRRTLSKEVYFQETMNNSNTPQRHQPQDPSSVLEKKVQSCLLKDHGIHLV